MFSVLKIWRKARIGIFGNNEDDCTSCGSVIGFGVEMKKRNWSSGSIHGQNNKKSFGYIFVQ